MNALTHSFDISLPCETAWDENVSISTKNDWQLCQKSMANWLRGRFPEATEFHIQAATGIPAGTVANWIYQKSKPSFQHASILMCVFGPAFLKSCLKQPPEWLEEAYRREQHKLIEAKIASLESERKSLAT